MKNQIATTTLILTAAILLLTSPAHGQGTLVYDNIGSGTNISSNGRSVGSTSSSLGEWSVAQSFSPSQSGYLDGLSFVVYGHAPDGVDIYLASSVSGLPDDSSLNLLVSGLHAPAYPPPIESIYSLLANPFINAGQTYWIVLKGTPLATGYNGWEMLKNPYDSQIDAYNQGGFGWTALSSELALSVFAGSSIPEPATLALASLGAFSLLACRRKSKK